jgi:hypothetical protein
MTTSYGYPQQPPEPCTDPKPAAECDLSDFDDVGCEVEGIAAEADYMKQHQDKLKQRRAQFDTARSAYDKSRGDVATDLWQIDEHLKRLREQLTCQLQKEQIQCLTDAWGKVAEQLYTCGAAQGCCVTEEQCRFEWSFDENPTAGAIGGLLEDFRRRVEAAETCFDTVLVKEPANLKIRVAELKTFAGGIGGSAATGTAASGATPSPTSPDYMRAFAQLLWAEYRRENIWLGFETAEEYTDCLCRALTCSLKGRQALARLTSMLAIIDCQAKRLSERCTWLRGNVVEQILADCRRMAPTSTTEQPQQYSL